MKTAKNIVSNQTLFEMTVIHQQLIQLDDLLESFDYQTTNLEFLGSIQESILTSIDQLNHEILAHSYWNTAKYPILE